jgi:hypothetical protein
VLLRALGILAVTAHHVALFPWMGGAHILLAVAGHSFARFQLGAARTTDRAAGLFTAVRRVALPSALFITLACLVFRDNDLPEIMVLHYGKQQWFYWYVEALVEILLVLALLLSSRRVRALERRFGFGFALAVVGFGLCLRYHVIPTPHVAIEPSRFHTALWVFALGWAAERASRHWHRALLSVVAITCLHGYFADASRVRLVTAGVLLLIWVPSVRVVRPLQHGIGVLAASSLWLYLTQRHVYPRLEDALPAWAVLAVTLLVGIAVWWLVDRGWPRLRAPVRAARADGPPRTPAASGCSALPGSPGSPPAPVGAALRCRPPAPAG